MSQPLEKVRQDSAQRAHRLPPLRHDTRIVTTVSPVIAAQPIVLKDVEQALRAKTRFLSRKRWFDLAVATLALIVLSPLLALIALSIKLTSKGPVLFKQRRLGRDNIPFTLIKFRSMYVDRQDVTGIKHTVARDPRITRIGRLIRSSYLDELPQLINVLKGDMSIVGPRAQVMGMRAAGMCYEELVPNYRLRHIVRPGLTGLAQVRGLRGEIKDAEHAIGRVDADLEYIRSATLWFDVKILALTPLSVLLGRVDL